MSWAKLGLYVHACSTWDGRVVDEYDPEFITCTCFQPTPELLALQDALAVKLDRKRGMLPPEDA